MWGHSGLRAVFVLSAGALVLDDCSKLVEAFAGVLFVLILLFAILALLVVGSVVLNVIFLIKNVHSPSARSRRLGTIFGALGAVLGLMAATVVGTQSLAYAAFVALAMVVHIACLVVSVRAKPPEPAASAVANTMPCPRCFTPLVLVPQEDMTLHGCSHCGGTWLGAEDSQRVAATGFPPAVVELTRQARVHARTSPHVDHAVSCPVCAIALTRQRLEPAGVEVDFCPAHGSWFDGGEIERLAGLHLG